MVNWFVPCTCYEPCWFLKLLCSCYESLPFTQLIAFIFPRMSTQLSHEGDKDNTCCWSVPLGVSQEVKYTRRISMALIIIHVLGPAYVTSLLGPLIAIVMGVVVLVSFNQITYSTAGFLYIAGSLGDLGNGIVYCMKNLAGVDGSTMVTSVLYALPPFIGSVLFLVGSVCAFKSVKKWGIVEPRNTQSRDFGEVGTQCC